MINRLKKLLGIFVAAELYFVIVFYLTAMYSASNQDGIMNFILFGGASYTKVFWIGQILLGILIPLVLTLTPVIKSRGSIIVASVLVIIGGLSQMYVTIIGGQAYPMPLFPGKEVESVTNDGGIAAYSASPYEVLLGIGGIGIAVFLAVFAMTNLRILPASLADKDVDPHYDAAKSAGA
jgi:molybdopterin-containing oxidoreductase family membrane subunit